MATYTTKEDQHFAEVCPITICRDGEPILAVAGELGPAEGATVQDRAFADEVRRILETHADMLAALKASERMLKHYAGEPPLMSDPVDAARRPVLHAAWLSIKRARAAIAKAEGRADG